jgi:broad specificity phosphatase PhoE
VELICVRHGRTAWNADKRFQGHTDIPLDDEGRAQATALAALLAGARIDAAVSSDLVRAVETARIVLGPRDVALRLDPDWREMRFGEWEGLTWEQIVEANPQLGASSETSVKNYTPGGGETFEELCARIGRAVDRIAGELPADGVALVATHAGSLHALLSVLLGDAERAALRVRFLTASITRFRRTNGKWTLARLNQTAARVTSRRG